MRRMPFPGEWSEPLQKAVKHYYSFMQFIATVAIMLNPKQYTLLMTAFPVQLAAFLMTLVRESTRQYPSHVFALTAYLTRPPGPQIDHHLQRMASVVLAQPLPGARHDPAESLGAT